MGNAVTIFINSVSLLWKTNAILFAGIKSAFLNIHMEHDVLGSSWATPLYNITKASKVAKFYRNAGIMHDLTWVGASRYMR